MLSGDMPPEDITETLPSRRFAPRIYGVGAWTDHLHFGYDLVALVRPRVLVELGVDRGESYFTFCQAVAEQTTDTRCFAVDTWQGDEQAGGYDETTFAEVSEHNREHYSAFSELLRMPFDNALGRFAEEEIDVLHIDGLHTEAAVRHDVECWLPKLRPGGLLLMHDVSVRRAGFGVWKVWEALRGRGRNWTFEAGPGLGVWQKPPQHALPRPIESLLTAPNESSAPLAESYAARAAELGQRIAGEWRDGSIRGTPFARQTVVQVFFTRDGVHREEESVYARIGHDGPKELSFAIPDGGSEGGIRIDFVSALTTIEVQAVELLGGDGKVVREFASEELRVAGDGIRETTSGVLRLRITGVDPQVYLPAGKFGGGSLRLRLQVEIV